MGKTVENPKKHILSVRVSDDELKIIEAIRKRTGADRSRLLRMAVEEFVNAAKEMGVTG